MAVAASCDRGINILGLDNALLIILMYNGFFGNHEPGSHLDCLSTQHKGRGYSSSVSDTACRDNRNGNSVRYLGNQRHGGLLSYMAAGLHALSHHCVRPVLLHTAGQGHACYHRNHLNACCLPHFHIFFGVSGTGGNHLDAFLHNHLCHILRMGAQQHDIDAKRLICQLPGLADLVAHHFPRCIGTANQSETTCFGYGCCQVVFCYPGHAALNNRIFNS